ncbi:hypothetical protein THAOC_36084, partial [Thalassiosira oceanica]
SEGTAPPSGAAGTGSARGERPERPSFRSDVIGRGHVDDLRPPPSASGFRSVRSRRALPGVFVVTSTSGPPLRPVGPRTTCRDGAPSSGGTEAVTFDRSTSPSFRGAATGRPSRRRLAEAFVGGHRGGLVRRKSGGLEMGISANFRPLLKGGVPEQKGVHGSMERDEAVPGRPLGGLIFDDYEKRTTNTSQGPLRPAPSDATISSRDKITQCWRERSIQYPKIVHGARGRRSRQATGAEGGGCTFFALRGLDPRRAGCPLEAQGPTGAGRATSGAASASPRRRMTRKTPSRGRGSARHLTGEEEARGRRRDARRWPRRGRC